jgi:putative NADH-flavin reductase
MDSNELASNFKSHDAILSALGKNGPPNSNFEEITLYSETIKSIVNAMRQSGVKRLLCVTSFYTKRNFFLQTSKFENKKIFVLIKKR